MIFFFLLQLHQNPFSLLPLSLPPSTPLPTPLQMISELQKSDAGLISKCCTFISWLQTQSFLRLQRLSAREGLYITYLTPWEFKIWLEFPSLCTGWVIPRDAQCRYTPVDLMGLGINVLHPIKFGEFEHYWCFNPSVITGNSDGIFCVSTAMKYCSCHWPSSLASSWLSWFLQSSPSSGKVSGTVEGITAEWWWLQKVLRKWHK